MNFKQGKIKPSTGITQEVITVIIMNPSKCNYVVIKYINRIQKMEKRKTNHAEK